MDRKVLKQRTSAGQVRWLEGEMQGWVSDGLIEQSAADRIAERYRSQLKHGGRTWLIYVLGIFAASLLGAGVIMFFASNWEYITRFQKLLLICTALSGVYWGGYVLKYKRDYPIIGSALILLGSILFGSGIYLVAQAFNISAHFPNGALLWMLGIIPLILLEKSRPLLVESAMLFCLWVGAEFKAVEPFSHSAYAYLSLMLRLLLATLPLALIWKMTYRFGHKYNAALLFLATGFLLIIFIITGDDMGGFDSDGLGYAFPITFCAAFGAFSIWHRKNPALPLFDDVYRSLAISFTGPIIYILTFPRVADNFSVNSLSPFLLGVSILLAATTVGIYVKLSNRGLLKDSYWDRAEFGLYFGPIVWVTLVFFTLLIEDSGAMVAILSNLALFGFIIGVVAVGTRTGRPSFVNYGAALFGLLIITRYFDWFWELMDRSLFFILGGLLLLVGAIFLEKRRRALVLRAKEASI